MNLELEQHSLVSIIIATYNQSHKIGETLESVINQNYENWECIIVDDKSTDDTKNVVHKYCEKDSRIKYYYSSKKVKKGPNAARNHGIDKSRGNLIMSLDSDDLLNERHLEFKVKAFEDNPDIDCVLSNTILVDDSINEIKKENRTLLTNNLLEDFIVLKVSWYMHDTMWKKSFLEGKKLYNDDLFKMLDRDFHIRRLLENPKIHHINKFLSYYRVYANSNSSNQDVNVLESRHFAVINIIKLLKKENKLSKKIAYFYLKFQIRNVVVFYKSKKCIPSYFELIKHTFTFNFKNIIWVFRLILAYLSFKLTDRGLVLVK